MIQRLSSDNVVGAMLLIFLFVVFVFCLETIIFIYILTLVEGEVLISFLLKQNYQNHKLKIL